MISKLESGNYNPTFKQIHKISRKLTNSANMFKTILKEIIQSLDIISNTSLNGMPVINNTFCKKKSKSN